MLSWDEIHKGLADRGYGNHAKLARRWRVGESTVSRFLGGVLVARRLKRLTAKLLGVDETEIPDPERCPTCNQPYRQAG